jgi:integrase
LRRVQSWNHVKKQFKNGIAKLGRQRYEVLVTRRDPRSGQRVSRRRLVEGPRSQAEAEKREVEAELDADLSGPADRALTLGDYAQQWLEARSATLKPSTRAKYVNDLEGHILPNLGDMMLADVRPRDVSLFLARSPGAPNSKKNRLALLRVMAKDAIADELIDRDFCLRVSVTVPPVYTEAEPNLLGDDQLDAVIEHIPRYWQDLACTLAYTGLRWGEVTALHWADVDFERRLVSVRWNNWKGHLGPPKSRNGYRTVPLVEPLPELLQARRRRMVAKQHPGLRSGLVFPTRQGKAHKGTPLNRVLKEACEPAEVAIRFTPHGLRRTWNNIARRIAGGLVVRAMIGHGSEAMTAHYSLVDESEKRMTAEAVVARLRKRDQSGESTPSLLVDKMVDGSAATLPSVGGNPQ